MNKTILQGFISKLSFIDEITKNLSNKLFEIEILSIDNEKNIINGKVNIKNDNQVDESISFETKFNETEDFLIFKTTIKNSQEIKESVDTFAVVNPKSKAFFTPKIKYLLHLVDGTVKQAYIVNKKYKFSNGISENYTKVNMDNKEIANDINNFYTSNKSRR